MIDPPAVGKLQPCPCCSQPMPASKVLVHGNTVAYDGKQVKVSGQPMEILTLLAARMPAIVSREAIYPTLWGFANEPDFAAKQIEVIVWRLRKSLLPIGLGIACEIKRGYRLVTL